MLRRPFMGYQSLGGFCVFFRFVFFPALIDSAVLLSAFFFFLVCMLGLAPGPLLVSDADDGARRGLGLSRRMADGVLYAVWCKMERERFTT